LDTNKYQFLIKKKVLDPDLTIGTGKKVKKFLNKILGTGTVTLVSRFNKEYFWSCRSCLPVKFQNIGKEVNAGTVLFILAST
jgi:hypothetical protein